MFSCGNFRKKAQGGALTPLQSLTNSCVFAFNADTNGWIGNNYNSEVGNVVLTRSQASQVTGRIGQGVNINESSARAPRALNVNNPDLRLHDNGADVSFILSFWFQRNTTGPTYRTLFYMGGDITQNTGGFFIMIQTDGQQNGFIDFINENRESSPVRTVLYRVNYTEIQVQRFRWHHLQIGYNAITKTFKVYLNTILQTGVNTNTNDYFSMGNYNNSEITIGTKRNHPLSAAARIDALHVFKGLEISQDLVQTLYNNGNGIQLFP